MENEEMRKLLNIMIKQSVNEPVSQTTKDIKTLASVIKMLSDNIETRVSKAKMKIRRAPSKKVVKPIPKDPKIISQQNAQSSQAMQNDPPKISDKQNDDPSSAESEHDSDLVPNERSIQSIKQKTKGYGEEK